MKEPVAFGIRSTSEVESQKPEQTSQHTARHGLGSSLTQSQSAPLVGPALGRMRVCRRIRAWMLVLPVDVLLLLTPVLWNPQQVKATISMAVLSLVLITRGVRYRAKLHISVLDDLPDLLGRLLTATAIVATVIALRHQQEEVTRFLGNAALAIGLVVAGRVLTTQAILWGRRRRITAHRTVLVGGGALCVELAATLQQHPRYGLNVIGFVDDSTSAPAATVLSRLGNQSELEDVVRRTGADVVLIADSPTGVALSDRIRSPACEQCDILIVPKMHLLHTQTGIEDRIGSIPIMRILTPNLSGPRRLVKQRSMSWAPAC